MKTLKSIVISFIKILKHINKIFIPESFNTNISHQIFDNKVTFVNSQPKNTNSKGDFVLQNRVETFVLKISDVQK